MDTEKPRVRLFQNVYEARRGFTTIIDGLPERIGFDVKRIFYIYGVPRDVDRGGHSHRNCTQFLISLRDAIIVDIDGESFGLHSPNMGIYVYPGETVTMHFTSDDCILLVLASEHYDKEDYVNADSVPKSDSE